jgi:hypothetical protein
MSENPKTLTNADDREVSMAENADLRQRVSKLEATVETLMSRLEPKAAPALPLEVRVARGERIPTAVEQIAGSGSRAARQLGAPVGPFADGGVQVLRRGHDTSHTAAPRPPMLLGEPNRR